MALPGPVVSASPSGKERWWLGKNWEAFGSFSNGQTGKFSPQEKRKGEIVVVLYKPGLTLA